MWKSEMFNRLNLRNLFLPLGCMGLCLFNGFAMAQQAKPLMAYVGTFSSPLKDTLPTQVDLPPGNGRGIHLFQVNRENGSLVASGVYEMGNSPSCLAVNQAGTHLYSANETERVGNDKQGTVSSFSIDPMTGSITLLNSVPSGGAAAAAFSV